MQEYKAKVLEIKNYTDNNKLEFLILKIEKKFNFLPGQFAMLAMDDFKLFGNQSQLKWTSYSIASAPEEEIMEFCFKIKDTPGFSNHLGQYIKEGDIINVRGPFGRFLLNNNATEHLFIATGAGIAPFMSMIKHLINTEDEIPMKLFFGFRTHKQFLYKDELEDLQKVDSFSLYTITSREGPKGHVQSLLEKHNFTTEEDVYLCGNKEMMDQTKALIKSKGFSDDKIHIEVW